MFTEGWKSSPELSIAAALPSSSGWWWPCYHPNKGQCWHGPSWGPELQAEVVGEQGAAGAGDTPGLRHPLTCFPPPPHPVSAEASQEIFKIASMAPGALLLEAQKEYEVRPAAPLWVLPALRRLGWLQCKPLPVLSHGDGKGDIPEVPARAKVPGRGLPWPLVPGVLGLPELTLTSEQPETHPMGHAPLQKESQKADEYLREIKDQKLLPEAVSQCIEAAGYEHEPDTQKSLLRVSEAKGGFWLRLKTSLSRVAVTLWPTQPQHWMPLAGSLLWEVLH